MSITKTGRRKSVLGKNVVYLVSESESDSENLKEDRKTSTPLIVDHYYYLGDTHVFYVAFFQKNHFCLGIKILAQRQSRKAHKKHRDGHGSACCQTPTIVTKSKMTFGTQPVSTFNICLTFNRC